MAEEQIDPAIIKKTQDILGKYVKKPPLSEKLLKRPPFRFLQDVICSVTKETGCLNGLYTKTELTAEGIADRNAKIIFLQKLIDVLKIVSGENISARPSKIVAGHEPEKTNELLQVLGNCLNKKLDFKSAIQQNTGTVKKDEAKEQISDTKKEGRDKKVVEPKSSGKIKENNPKEDNKIRNATTKEIKEKQKVTPVTTKGTPKQKEKSKKEIKTSISESSKQEIKFPSKKLENVEKIKEKHLDLKKGELKIDSGASLKNDIETKKLNESRKLPDHIEGIQLLTSNNTNIDDNPSFEVKHKPVTSAVKENRKLSAKKQKKIKQLEDLPINKEILEQDISKNKIEYGLDEEIENKNIDKIQENKKLSGKNRQSSSDKNNLNLSAVETNSLSNNENIVTQIASVPAEMKKENNSENLNNQNNKSDISVEETVPVQRQSTFTRDESKDIYSRPRTSLRPPSVRPPSARPGAPRRRDKNVEIVLQPNDQIKVAGIQMKVDSFNNELEDDGETLVVIESNIKMNEENLEILKSDDIKIDDNSQQGHLVQQILETQKELVQNHDQKELKDEDLDVATIQNRQSSAKQMNSLRDVIQNLTRSINPLGKLMDFIPEDVDAMQLEMNMWRDLYSQTSIELKKEKSLTESAIEPMKNQLEQIDATIKEYIEMIDDLRAKILQNSEKIFKLLTD